MLLPNPKKYAASYYKKELTPFASKRINEIVNNMYQYHRINDEEYNDALVKLETFFKPAATVQEGEEVFEGDETTLENLENSATQEEEVN